MTREEFEQMLQDEDSRLLQISAIEHKEIPSINNFGKITHYVTPEGFKWSIQEQIGEYDNWYQGHGSY